MALHQYWPTTKKEFFHWKGYSWVKVNDRWGGFTIKIQVLGRRQIKVFWLMYNYLRATICFTIEFMAFCASNYQFGRRFKAIFFIWESSKKTQHFSNIWNATLAPFDPLKLRPWSASHYERGCYSKSRKKKAKDE